MTKDQKDAVASSSLTAIACGVFWGGLLLATGNKYWVLFLLLWALFGFGVGLATTWYEGEL